jgi:hypothetical protein
MYIFVFTVAIPVNYTSEFRELFEATTYFNRNSLSSVRRNQHTYGMLYVRIICAYAFSFSATL